jgi:acetyl-CoA carboxylase biotin carboxyl carrier protein
MSLDICAHITGTVWKVEAQVGDVVQEGQTLVILESMKMEMPIEAPEAGTVTEVLAQPGQSVEEGEVLMRLGPST